MSHKTGNVNEEKHVPFIEETDKGYRVTVGKPAIHPMLEAHYIEAIELHVDGKLIERKELKPEDTPVVEFACEKGTKVEAVEYCNIHGSWINSL